MRSVQSLDSLQRYNNVQMQQSYQQRAQQQLAQQQERQVAQQRWQQLQQQQQQQQHIHLTGQYQVSSSQAMPFIPSHVERYSMRDSLRASSTSAPPQMSLTQQIRPHGVNPVCPIPLPAPVSICQPNSCSSSPQA